MRARTTGELSALPRHAAAYVPYRTGRILCGHADHQNYIAIESLPDTQRHIQACGCLQCGTAGHVQLAIGQHLISGTSDLTLYSADGNAASNDPAYVLGFYSAHV